MAECTFMPHINHHQQALEQTDESVSRFDQLFFDFESRRQRQNQYSDWYPEGLVERFFTSSFMLLSSWSVHVMSFSFEFLDVF